MVGYTVLASSKDPVCRLLETNLEKAIGDGASEILQLDLVSFYGSESDAVGVIYEVVCHGVMQVIVKPRSKAYGLRNGRVNDPRSNFGGMLVHVVQERYAVLARPEVGIYLEGNYEFNHRKWNEVLRRFKGYCAENSSIPRHILIPFSL